MTRQKIYDQAAQALGIVPGWMKALPDSQIEAVWNDFVWYHSDTALSAREKMLVGFGAAAAVECHY